ncbi:hypothetical protein QQF64_035776 [Cirrhinus molitorella]|uniref:Uncharacterized protein n=1 Tax=Cirrhinus molitorella TaxID=172907 RepID=A0ABR3NGQ3_9TELE
MSLSPDCATACRPSKPKGGLMMHANNAPCAEHHDAKATYNKHKQAWHATRRDKYVKDARHAASPKQQKKGETKPTDTDRPVQTHH